VKRLIAEFEPQSYTQIIFPHKDTDWICCLEEACNTFVNIINAIRKYQWCIVICTDIDKVKSYFSSDENLIFMHYKTNDTWARDCSAISIEENTKTILLDFTFNGWGNKFRSDKDNALTQALYPDAKECNFILEGGGIETNGVDILLTTAHTMLNKNRNKFLTKEAITKSLQDYFGMKNILYLYHGYLAGDDTDSHIDTLVRFVDKKTLVYVCCEDQEDEHYHSLKLMENELKYFAKIYNLKLIALPMCDAVYDKGERLPATYANFLFVNNAILLPIYNVKQDQKAIEIFKNIFQDKEIIPIDCSILIRQHGSLHCISMNFVNQIFLDTIHKKERRKIYANPRYSKRDY
jgi:agmatine/peptidylarginine deiminase